MVDQYKVPVESLKLDCQLGEIGLDELKNLGEIRVIGQERAVNALEFGLKTDKKGYNIFVSGISGTGRNSYVNLITEEKASSRPAPKDWLYVYNFKDSARPLAVDLNSGDGCEFKKDIEKSIHVIGEEIRNTFNSKNYESMKNILYKQYDEEYKKLINILNEIAEKFEFVFIQSEKGLVSMPLFNGKAMSEEEYKDLSPEEFEVLKDKSNQLNIETVEIFNHIKELEDEFKDKLNRLDIEFAERSISIYFMKLEDRYEYSEKAVKYLKMMREDVLDNIDQFKKGEAQANPGALAMLSGGNKQEDFFKRYEVNVFIDNSEQKSAPVIVVDNPNYSNLLGSIEYKNEMGVVKTDFTHIKPGAVHSASGGYLILQVSEVLTNPYAWAGLMRSLITEKIAIESVEQSYGFLTISTIKPEPIPLDIKVILIGSAYVYSMLFAYDDKFKKLFKITADFHVDMKRSQENIDKMVRFILTNCKKYNLRDLDKEAMGRVIEYCSRLTANKKKLSTRFNMILDIIIEADVWAGDESSYVVTKAHVEKAIDHKALRGNQYEEMILEMFEEGDYLIDVEGEKVGEINGLAVISTGEYMFGKPNKITVSTFKGKSGLINIEREARTSGKIHDKGVMIINGYLGHRYAQNRPLSIAASIVFEQLYSGVDGDSASSTELYAILSSLSEVPIKQSLAVTGSVNQRGEIQPIGGVNEKIEGFFKVCKMKGLNGEQGVLIPHQNVKNLMLDDEVIEAVKAGQFTIYSVKNVDEGIEILTGMPAGEMNKDKKYPEGTINYLVNEKLELYAGESKESDKKEEASKEK